MFSHDFSVFQIFLDQPQDSRLSGNHLLRHIWTILPCDKRDTRTHAFQGVLSSHDQSAVERFHTTFHTCVKNDICHFSCTRQLGDKRLFLKDVCRLQNTDGFAPTLHLRRLKRHIKKMSYPFLLFFWFFLNIFYQRWKTSRNASLNSRHGTSTEITDL